MESRKNALNLLREYSARVYDAGNFMINNHKFLYTIMELGEGKLFSDWTTELAELYEENSNRFETKKNIVQYGINTIAAMVVSFTNYLQANTTHGDMNPKNVMVHFEGTKKDILLSPAGTLDLNSIKVILIDAGTSKAEGTNELYGIENDAFRLLDNGRRALKMLLTKKEFQSLFYLLFPDKIGPLLSEKKAQAPVLPSVKVSKYTILNLSKNISLTLLRMCGLITYLLGVSEDANLVEDMREPRSDGRDNPGRILRSILLDTNKGIYDYLPYDIFSPRFIQTWATINDNIDDRYRHEFINWNDLINSLAKKKYNYIGDAKDFLIGNSDSIPLQ
ncbi:hypothetical protein [Limosilactobacillus reuteri]|uniref:hypothetical protein n=1 Tax=Limosilactobacillus reuteri TaxID=1598 RepID=UPI001E532A1C|nr:hypothetical protein [Limosilactobacillus reuteri]